MHNATKKEFLKSDNGKALNCPFYTKLRVARHTRVK